MVAEKVRQRKSAAVAELAQRLNSCLGFVAVDYRGITVAEISLLRSRLRDFDARMKIVKNTVLRFAIAKSGLNCQSLAESLAGPTALVFVNGELGPTLKLLLEDVREDFALQVKFSFIEGQIYSPQQTQALSKLPGREQLIAQLLGTLNAPVQQLAGGMLAVPQGLVRVLNAAQEKLAA